MSVRTGLCCLWLAVLSLVSVSAFSAEPIRIAVIDFQVQSDDPAYKYYGKGFAEFTVIELAASADVLVIAREKRNQALAEVEFSLSDSADAARQLRAGKLLSAQYLVGGSVFEMGGKLVVTVTITDVEQGTAVFTDKASGAPGAYDAISASLAGKLLTYFRLKTPPSVLAKVEKAELKPAETVQRFSTAVDALDKKDIPTAKAELAKAKKLDPENEAVKIYLSKLAMNTSKFKLIAEMYFPGVNPASLAFIQYDKLEATGTWPGVGLGLPPSITMATPDFELMENDIRANIAYQFPIGGNMGLDIEAMIPYFTSTYYVNNVLPFEDQYGIEDWGGIIGFGWAPAETFSIGAAVSLYVQNRKRGMPLAVTDTFFRQAASAGLLVKTPDASVTYDLFIGCPFDQLIRGNPSDGSLQAVQAPLFAENTLTLALADRRVFIIVKQLNDLAFDRVFYCGRLLAAAEWWPLDWFGCHVSGEGSLTLVDADLQWGFGVSGGVTFRIPDWGLDLDIGYAYRQRPSRTISGILFPDYLLRFGISKSLIFFSR